MNKLSDWLTVLRTSALTGKENGGVCLAHLGVYDLEPKEILVIRLFKTLCQRLNFKTNFKYYFLREGTRGSNKRSVTMPEARHG